MLVVLEEPVGLPGVGFLVSGPSCVRTAVSPLDAGYSFLGSPVPFLLPAYHWSPTACPPSRPALGPQALVATSRGPPQPGHGAELSRESPGESLCREQQLLAKELKHAEKLDCV